MLLKGKEIKDIKEWEGVSVVIARDVWMCIKKCGWGVFIFFLWCCENRKPVLICLRQEVCTLRKSQASINLLDIRNFYFAKF